MRFTFRQRDVAGFAGFGAAFRVAVVFAVVVQMYGQPARAQYCQSYVATFADTSDNCAGDPMYDRFIGVDTFLWQGKEMLMVNFGNELTLYDIQDPLNPQPLGTTNFNIEYHSDIDQNLYGFAVADDHRYVVAGFHIEGWGLADLGTADLPTWNGLMLRQGEDLQGNPMSIPIDAAIDGGCVFHTGGQDYLVAKPFGYADHNLSFIYRQTGINGDDLEKVAEIPFQVNHGWHMNDAQTHYLYFRGHMARVASYTFVDTPDTLVEQSAVFGGAVNTLDIDVEQRVAATCTINGLSIYDLTDPAVPELVGTNPDVVCNVIAIRYPLVFTSLMIGSTFAKLIDISDPAAPLVIDQGFWGEETAEWNDFECARGRSAAFSRDAQTLYLARFGVLQVYDVGDCIPGYCGDQVVDADETCDPPSSCPTSCFPSSDACTVVSLEGRAESCTAECVETPLTECIDDDGCCPAGCNAVSDTDCNENTNNNGNTDTQDTDGSKAGGCGCRTRRPPAPPASPDLPLPLPLPLLLLSGIGLSFWIRKKTKRKSK